MAYIKENKAALAALYNRIGNHLAAELPNGWTHVCLGFFVDKHGHEEMLIYTTQDEGKQWYDFMDVVFASDDIMVGVFDCKERCQELYELCAKAGDKWSNFTLIIDAEGRFKAEYSYDPLEKMSPVINAMWIGEYLE